MTGTIFFQFKPKMIGKLSYYLFLRITVIYYYKKALDPKGRPAPVT